MKIDWKALAKSPGYRSLKLALVNDVIQASRAKHPMRKKEEFYKLFHWIITRAQHYSCRLNKPMELVLLEWETKRNGSWWLNAYGESYQPKLPSGKPRNVKKTRMETYCNKHWHSNDKKAYLFD